MRGYRISRYRKSPGNCAYEKLREQDKTMTNLTRHIRTACIGGLIVGSVAAAVYGFNSLDRIVLEAGITFYDAEVSTQSVVGSAETIKGE